MDTRPTLFAQLVRGVAAGLVPEDLAPKPPEPVGFSDLRIRTKDRQLVTFSPNEVQSAYLDLLLPGWRGGARPFESSPPSTWGDSRRNHPSANPPSPSESRGGSEMQGVREILLKARQFGFSTLIGALFFCDTINRPNTVTVVIANDSDSTAKLFRMVRTFYEHLPDAKKPRTQYANRNEFYWPEINSSYYVGTAGDRGFGRGDTINNLHCSEVAFWPAAGELMTGLLQAVPAEGNVFLETTANGLGNFYHSEYTLAERRQSRFTARFFGWYMHPEYAWTPRDLAEVEEYDRLASDRSSEEIGKEQALVEAYGVTEAQLAWRRRKATEPGMRTKLAQEYPSNAAEAFIASGSPYFNREKLTQRLTSLDAVEWPIRPSLLEGLDLLRRLQPGELEIYRLPSPGCEYVIGADTAEGLTGIGDHDSDSADVLDAETWEQVAHLHGKWDTHHYGLLLAELGTFYNLACLGVERNNHGHAVINAIVHAAGYPAMDDGDPGGLYMHADYDEAKGVNERRAGWPTTAKSKTFALDSLATAIEEEDLTLNSVRSVGELLTFVKLPGGKSGGESGSHDDAVMSLAIAVAVLKVRPKRVTYRAVGGGRGAPAVDWGR